MCGDGVTEGAELCDDGPANGSFACGCQLDCRFAPDTTPCDDLLFCTDSDRCDGGGLCTPGSVRDCADADPCTEDRCDEALDDCFRAPWDGPGIDLFDLAAIEDGGTLGLEILSTTTQWEGLTPVTVQEIRYTSWQSEGCVRSLVRI